MSSEGKHQQLSSVCMLHIQMLLFWAAIGILAKLGYAVDNDDEESRCAVYVTASNVEEGMVKVAKRYANQTRSSPPEAGK